MTIGRSRAAHLAAAVVLLATTLAMAGCGSLGGDYNTLSPEGEVANKQADLFILVSIIAAVVLALVGAAIVYLLIRFRRRSDDEPPPVQIHGNTRLEIAWTIAPAVLLAVIAVPTLIGIIDLGRSPSEDALHVRVVAFQWDWRFEYLDPEFADADGEPLTTEELRIPVDREIGVELESKDVIHSFWVPKLAGKLDVMPGRTNEMWFNADTAGVFSGQCAEFCGIGHSIMKFDVIAVSEEDFQVWLGDQLTLQANAARDAAAR